MLAWFFVHPVSLFLFISSHSDIFRQRHHFIIIRHTRHTRCLSREEMERKESIPKGLELIDIFDINKLFLFIIVCYLNHKSCSVAQNPLLFFSFPFRFRLPITHGVKAFVVRHLSMYFWLSKIELWYTSQEYHDISGWIKERSKKMKTTDNNKIIVMIIESIAPPVRLIHYQTTIIIIYLLFFFHHTERIFINYHRIKTRDI